MIMQEKKKKCHPFVILFNDISFVLCNVVSFKYLCRNECFRDDLEFLLEEDLSHINLCALHCEMRNLEQLLGSLGLFSYRVGTLDKLNEELAKYGPETSQSFQRIKIKKKPGQETLVEKHNIKVASFSGEFYCMKSYFLYT